ncbi:membrane protein insertase YidC [Sphingomonas sp. 1P06PA]|uniref:membrane protein insertase YidC n=1 Tax=Sphingomonas sp. 1P06PA TaxID=554121 RepID=UPI0039A77B0D
MGGNDQRNMILAIVLSALVLFGWSLLSERIMPTANPPATKIEKGKTTAVPNPAADPAADSPAAMRTRTAVLAEGQRVRIETPRLAGSINLTGARIDDLTLTTYRETIAKNSPPIRLLSPSGAPDAYFAGFGWTGDGVSLPGPATVWRADGTLLAPGRPVTLAWDNATGQRFRIRLSIDDGYLFTIRQTVANGAGGAVAVQPYGLISRVGISKDPDSWTIHTGPTAVIPGQKLRHVNFKEVDEAGAAGDRFTTNGGWLGFGDKYWLTALVPPAGRTVEAGFRAASGSRYQADFAGAATIVPAGRAFSSEQRFFAGAKEVALLQSYEKQQGITRFDDAIDWGWFAVIERPIFWLLDQIFKAVGNFGVAIIGLTFIIRGLMFPIAQRQFASMAGMRAVQPKMKALQERYKDDKQALQLKMLELYKEEKVNPLAGCLPILIQIPIFYALYKVLLLTIEMRHQPFVLWIKDLSAPDPLTPLNLFGLLAFTPPQFIAIGVLPILLGITMYYQFKLNPQAMDPMQAQIFSIMPWIFMFIMAPFAAGLQLYWVTSNILTIAQQKWLYSRHPSLKQAPAK